jgi:ribosomal protein S27AE
MDTFESIKEDIEKTDNDCRRIFEYRLPRGCGATTFMVNFANQRAMCGERVLYLENKIDALKAFKLHEGVKAMPATGGYQYWLHLLVYAEKKYDWIICDSLFIPTSKDYWFRTFLKMGTKKGLLIIDSVEGELIKFTD